MKIKLLNPKKFRPRANQRYILLGQYMNVIEVVVYTYKHPTSHQGWDVVKSLQIRKNANTD